MNILDTVGGSREKLLSQIETENDVANQEVTTPAANNIKPSMISEEDPQSLSKTERRDKSNKFEEDGKSQASGTSSRMMKILQQKKERLERQTKENSEREALASERRQRYVEQNVEQD